MEKIYHSYYHLLDVIEDSILKDDLVKVKKDIENDSKLLQMIRDYRVHPTDELKFQIYENKSYQDFKRLETQVNILIMQINLKFKQVKDK